jgi:hypothetical protein
MAWSFHGKVLDAFIQILFPPRPGVVGAGEAFDTIDRSNSDDNDDTDGFDVVDSVDDDDDDPAIILGALRS